MHDRDRANAVASEKAVLVRVQLDDAPTSDDPLAELNGLVKTAGAEVVAGLVQRRHMPDPAAYLGSGKLEELADVVEQHEADVVIFDNDLSPGQTRNLEKRLKTKVIDRTELILDIFATHAQTYEARLAVELAQLEYSLPRLKQMWSHLSRLKMGVGMRGPGEKQLEVDRRLVEKRIHELRQELHAIEKRKERLVASRGDRMTVCLVGYTNAGKSTLMNALTEAEVLAEDKLFATLDTRTRRWHLPGWGPVLLSDTVGFIRELPHRLIASFKATLEEARGADLLLHVCDASNPAVLEQISAVFSVLEELKIEEKDTLLVVNKIDQLADEAAWAQIRNRYPKSVAISARTGEGLDQLAQAVSEGLSHGFLDIDVEMPVDEGKLMAYLSNHGEVLSRTYHEDRVVFHVRLPKQHYGRILKPGVTIRRREVIVDPEVA
ncbi:MAG: GTPase HflX [Planctomycetales bacterium]|nr:GTPase HflX [Planctomycetales bacterium]